MVNQELYFYNREREYIEFVNYRLKTKLIDFDRLLATTLTDKDVWELIESIWTLTERHYEEKEEWDLQAKYSIGNVGIKSVSEHEIKETKKGATEIDEKIFD